MIREELSADKIVHSYDVVVNPLNRNKIHNDRAAALDLEAVKRNVIYGSRRTTFVSGKQVGIDARCKVQIRRQNRADIRPVERRHGVYPVPFKR